MGTQVYSYGLLAPTLNDDLVWAQFRAAHKYQNQLVEIELRRRTRANEALSRFGLAEIEAEVADLDRQVKDALAATKEARIEARSRKAPEWALAIKALKEDRKAARTRLREARKALKEDAAVQVELAEINKDAHAEHIAARAACGVYWGTYLGIEQAVDAAKRAKGDPHFQRFRGGHVAVELIKGMLIERAYACDDTRLRIELAPTPVPGRGIERKTGAHRGKDMPRVRLRIGSTETREPVWAEWPVVWHRPVPDGGIIKWAKITATPVASHIRWKLHLTLEMPPQHLRPVNDRAIAVDLRWSKMIAGGIETVAAATYVATDANDGALAVDPAIASALALAAEIHSVRDERINKIREQVVTFRDGHRVSMPEALVERMSHVWQWKSAGRFAALTRLWREHRFDGDADLFDRLEDWRRGDKRLWEWEANARRKALARRRDDYRVFAAGVAERYGTLVLEKLDLRALAQERSAEDGDELGPTSRTQRTLVAPSEMRTALIWAFKKRGGTVVEVPAGFGCRKMLMAHLGGASRVKGGEAEADVELAAAPNRFARSKVRAQRKAA